MSLDRIAVVNRGEPAMRLIHAVREHNAEHGTRWRTLALFTEPDRRAMFVREADESWCLGPAQVTHAATGRRRSAYVDHALLERALVGTRATAAWVGWGFVAEDAAFADLCERLGVTFIGPSARVIRELGDKIGAKRICERAGVPIAPWSGGELPTLAQAREAAQLLGFPLMLKASAGGGGRGIRRIRDLDDLDAAYERARDEARAAFGDDRVFLERLMVGARHVEVQFVADAHGHAWGVGVRDCSVQRRNQKVIEESGSAALTDEQVREVTGAAVRLVQASGYTNAGTAEFLYEPDSGRFSFMEVNARLQVEHPVTEATTGLDLVKLQLLVADGGQLQGDPPPAQGCALEARLNAEDPARGFAPSPGRVLRFRQPAGPGVRLDTGVGEGDPIPPDFDSMIAKVVAWGRSRSEAIGRLRRALADTTVVLDGGTTNKTFLLALLQHPDFLQGQVDIGWLERVSDDLVGASSPHGAIALAAGAIEAFDAVEALELARFQSLAMRGRPEVGAGIGHEVEVSYQGVLHKILVRRLRPGRYRLGRNGEELEVEVDRLGDFERRLRSSGGAWGVVVVPQGPDFLVEVEHVPHRIGRDDRGVVRSPAPAVVLSVLVEPGARVEAGTRVAVLEAMKMEMAVAAPVAGVVREVNVAAGLQVEAGTRLLVVEAESEDQETLVAAPLDFSPLRRPAPATLSSDERLRRCFDDLESLQLGYDLGQADVDALLGELRGLWARLDPTDPALWAAEAQLLGLFADVWAVFRQRQADREVEPDQPRSAEEYLFTFLRTLDPRQVTARFMRKLGRALRHLGVDDVERVAEQFGTLMLLFRARRAMDLQARVAMAVVERWLRLAAAGHRLPDEGTGLQNLLDEVEAASRWRHPGVRDLARSVRYWQFDLPEYERVKQGIYARVDEARHALRDNPHRPDRDEQLRLLADCAMPLAGRLIAQLAVESTSMATIDLEALLLRFYRARRVEGLRGELIGGLPTARAVYDHDGGRIEVYVTTADWTALSGTFSRLAGDVALLPPDRQVALDVYLRDTADAGPLDRVAVVVARALGRAGFDRPLRRVVTVLARPGGNTSHYLTFRWGRSGYHEEDVYRGIHPMLAKRLQLWRLANFKLDRLPATGEDVYLFRCVAHDNPEDERLFAFAEVRDATPRRDARGRVVGYPTMERMLRRALADVRRVQAARTDRDRLLWNRVYLQFWDSLRLEPDVLVTVVRRAAPETLGLGLEKVVAHVTLHDATTGAPRDTVVEFANPDGSGATVKFRAPHQRPLAPLTRYEQNAIRARRRGLVYPYEIVKHLAPAGGPGTVERVDGAIPPGRFVEHDLDVHGRLVPVDRPPGGNTANVVVGLISNRTRRYPDGMQRVIVLGDPTRQMGSLAEPECRRIVAALDLADELGVPLEWFAVSAGARIAMDSGTENLDWTARVLRRLVEFTQAGGEVNVVVCGVNVGAQSYWNAEATMLMHTRGVLVMTAAGSMVLTGKEALAFSGSVSAETNEGIGGYEHIMGPNGQAQYWARDVDEACAILMCHYEHGYVAPGERFPRRADTADPRDRDVCTFPHGDVEGAVFPTVGDIFGDATNPGRKRPFAIRRVMAAVVDQDHPTLERWPEHRDAETAVVWDGHLGGWPCTVIGIESRPIQRLGLLPADGPERWSAGTLFPQSSKKVARALNAASGNRPAVILANLSGFDGAPESMRKLQLEYGAEIGRAVVNFRGPVVFCVISRYHGGAYVVFSNRLNEDLEVAALEGTYASVIGGAPAAAVVFGRDTRRRAERDPRVLAAVRRVEAASPEERPALREELASARAQAHAEAIAAVAQEFDAVHSVQRAREVGSVHHVVPPSRLRPYLIEAVERGIRRVLSREGRRAEWDPAQPDGLGTDSSR